MLNKVILIGRLTRNPEKRFTRDDQSVANFTLAIDRNRTGTNGERQTDFIDCTAWGRQADFVEKWFTKGMLAIVVGSLQSSSDEDKNGNKRTKITVNCNEVQFGETKKAREANRNAGGQEFPPPPGDGDWTPGGGEDFEELPEGDDVPF